MSHSHDDAHPLALVGEGEDLKDGEVHDLASRGPQLHGGLVSPHQSQAHALSPLHQRHLATPTRELEAHKPTLTCFEGTNLYQMSQQLHVLIFNYLNVKKSILAESRGRDRRWLKHFLQLRPSIHEPGASLD